MLQFLTSVEKSRFAELQNNLAQLLITDAEQQELAALVGKAQRCASERSKAIEAVKQLILDNGIEVQTIFDAEAIQRAAAGFQVRKRKTTKSTTKVKILKVNEKSEQVLIQVKLDKAAGAPSRYKKGQKLGKFVSKNFKALDVDGQLVSNLLKYATPLGQNYFSTPEGKSELEVFAQFVHNAPLNS